MDRRVALEAAKRVVRYSLGLIALTIALNVAAALAKSSGVGFFAGLSGVIALMFAIVAMFRAGEPLGYSMFVRIVLAMLAAIPVVNIVTLVVLDVRVSRALA